MDRLTVQGGRKGRLLFLLGAMETLDEQFPDVDEDLVELDEPEV